jgi:hypothetical protein
MENNLNGTVTVSSNNLLNVTLTPPFGTTTSTHNLYSPPELIKAIIKDDCIELIYKRQYMVSNGWGMPRPEVYKDIYSRTGGDVRREIGTYVPAQDESYVFDSDLM